MVLSRESIKNGLVTEMLAEGERLGLIEAWTDEQRLASRQETLAQRPDGPVWVFAYGSLIWNPAFHYEHAEHARLFGYHRAFCLWTPLGRGTPDNPGLILGLERGGSCHGMAYRLHEDKVEEELDVVWAREMPTGSYKPTWVKIRTADGPVNAITFVIQPDQPRYACKLPIEQVAQSIATAAGKLGTCQEYFANTHAALHKMNVPDRYLDRLFEQVRKIQTQSAAGAR